MAAAPVGGFLMWTRASGSNAGVARHTAEFAFNANELIVFGESVRAGKRSRFHLPAVRGDCQVDDGPRPNNAGSAASVTIQMVKRIEAARAELTGAAQTMGRIQRALEAAGIVFIAGREMAPAFDFASPYGCRLPRAMLCISILPCITSLRAGILTRKTALRPKGLSTFVRLGRSDRSS